MPSIPRCNDEPFDYGAQKPDGQYTNYPTLPEEERVKGFVRPVRHSYVHKVCGAKTTMGQALAETYAREPTYYGSTFCARCQGHYQVKEFVWDGTDEEVGS